MVCFTGNLLRTARGGGIIVKCENIPSQFGSICNLWRWCRFHGMWKFSGRFSKLCRFFAFKRSEIWDALSEERARCGPANILIPSPGDSVWETKVYCCLEGQGRQDCQQIHQLLLRFRLFMCGRTLSLYSSTSSHLCSLFVSCVCIGMFQFIPLSLLFCSIWRLTAGAWTWASQWTTTWALSVFAAIRHRASTQPSSHCILQLSVDTLQAGWRKVPLEEAEAGWWEGRQWQ